MDPLTIEAYDRAPDRYATEWDEQPPPSDLRELIERYFRPGPTADVGCGSGRDTRWLQSHGFDAVGLDPSAGLLAEARSRHPDLRFSRAALPGLEEVPDGAFENVLCETVVMHLPLVDIPPAVRRLLQVLRPGGSLYISWRVTAGQDQRAGDGRLYSAFDPSLIMDALEGVTVLHDSESTSASSGRTVHRLVVRKATTMRGGNAIG